MKLYRRLSVLLSMLLALAVAPLAAGQSSGQQVTVLFTHDLHSHLLPAAGEDGEQYGGYARLMSAIQAQRRDAPDALLLDAGDFSMGTLFQTAYATSALELRAMGAMGYDVVTFGNHDYDYRASGLAGMLRAALDSGDPLPAVVEANYLPPAQGEAGYDETAQAVWDAFADYGVADYVLLERWGVWFAVFGLMGTDAHASAPMSGMVLHDAQATARRVVEQATADCLAQNGVEPVVICLSHSGTDGGRGEDYELARAVEGIDLIVSGHTHTVLDRPIQVGETYIVSAGEYGRNLGRITLNWDGSGVSLDAYELIPIHAGLEEDGEMAAWIEGAKGEVEENYLSGFGLGFDQVLARNPHRFGSVDQLYADPREQTLGNLITDAYLWAAQRATGEPVDLAVTAAGVIRASLPQGEITVSDVFNMVSLGIGADGVPGYPLVEAYLTGAELRTVLEIDASVAPMMPAARICVSGAAYTFNTNRMLFNKVTQAHLIRADGTLEEIEDDRLYRVVTGLYCVQMLGAVEDTSFGLLSVTPRTADGTPIPMEEIEDYILRDEQGNELKEWYAVASYLQEALDGEVDERYAQPEGRKSVYSSWNPVELLKNPNRFTFIALAVGLVVLGLAVLIVLLVTGRLRRTRGRRDNRGYQGYRGRRRRLR